MGGEATLILMPRIRCSHCRLEGGGLFMVWIRGRARSVGEQEGDSWCEDASILKEMLGGGEKTANSSFNSVSWILYPVLFDNATRRRIGVYCRIVGVAE